MTHIVFSEPDIATLQQAIALDESLAGDIVQIKDDFSVGPLQKIYETEGYQTRRDWWKNALTHSPYTEQIDLVDDKLAVHQLTKKLEAGEHLWIWVAQNAHDVCGYYWLMSQLKNYQGLVQIVFLNNLPFINEKGGIFYPTYLHQILPKEFLKAKKLARPITLSEFEIDPDEWKKITEADNNYIRILEGGKKLVGKPISHFDEQIISVIAKEPLKLQKLLQQFYQKQKLPLSDVFVVHRLKSLAAQEILSSEGDWEKGWKEITFQLMANDIEISTEISNH